jgi:hypothetical protein
MSGFDQSEKQQAYLRQLLATRIATRIEALKHPCPRCDAAIDEACVNLTLRKQDIIKKTKWPHPSRLPEGFKYVPD